MIQLSTEKEFKMKKVNKVNVRTLIDTCDAVTICCDDIESISDLTDTAKIYIANASGVVTHEVIIKCDSFHDRGVIDSIKVIAHD